MSTAAMILSPIFPRSVFSILPPFLRTRILQKWEAVAHFSCPSPFIAAGMRRRATAAAEVEDEREGRNDKTTPRLTYCNVHIHSPRRCRRSCFRRCCSHASCVHVIYCWCLLSVHNHFSSIVESYSPPHYSYYPPLFSALSAHVKRTSQAVPTRKRQNKKGDSAAERL